MMNKVIWKDNLTEIKKSWPRFLSILLIMLLGVAFFVGIRATSPAMVETARQFYEQYHLPDGQILSTLGLNEDDIQLIEEKGLTVDPLKALETTLNPLSERVKVYPNNNKDYFFAVEGALPQKADEIALDIKYRQSDINIGVVVELEQVSAAPKEDEDTNLEGLQAPYLTRTQFKVTGFVDTPLYFSKISRGVSNINGYVLVMPEAVAGDIYTEVLYWSTEAGRYRAYSDQYNQVMDDVQSDLEAAFAERPEIRLQQLKDDLNLTLSDGAKEIDEGYAELASAEKELESAKDELSEGQSKYESGSEELAKGYDEWASASTKLADGRNEYHDGLAELESGEAAYQSGLEEIETQEETLNNGEVEYQSGLAEYQSGVKTFNEKISSAQSELSLNKAKLDEAKEQLDASKAQLDEGLAALESGKAELTKGQEQMASELQQKIPNLSENLSNLKTQAQQGQFDEQTNQKILAESTSQAELTVIYLQQQLTQLTNQKTTLESQIKAAPEQIKQVNAGIAEVEAGLAELNEHLTPLAESESSLTEELATAEATVTEQQAIVDQAQLAYNEAVQARDEQATQLENLEPESPEYATVEAQLQEAEALVTQTHNTLTAEQATLAPLIATRDELSAQLSTISEQKTALTNQVTELESQKATLEEQLAGLNQLISPETAKQVEQLAGAIAFLQTQIEGLQAGLQEFATAQAEIATNEATLNEGQKAYEQGWNEYATGLKAYQEGKAQFDKEKQAGQTELDTAKSELATAREKLDNGWSQLNAGKEQLASSFNELATGREKLATVLQEIEDGETELADGLTELEDSQKELADAKKELEDGQKEYEENLAKFKSEKKDVLKELKKAEADLADGQKEVDDLKEPIYYLNQRDSFDSYDSLYDNANQIKQISTVFPLFFFAIAVLVTFTTIKRMVSEQRNYMGTMKQMGYPNHVILSKFVMYALLATVIGTVIGIELGYRIFPPVIMNAYNSLFHFDSAVTVRSHELNGLVALIALSCALIPAIWTPLQYLREQPARLLRPEPPKAGKKTMIERIGFIWNRLSFNRKMTIRNLLRYKGRNAMTLVGVAGCTMLIVTGFGISDTIDVLVETQFKQLQRYDAVLYLDEDAEQAKKDQVIDEVSHHSELDKTLEIHSANWQTDTNAAVQSVSVIVPLDDYQGFLDIHERQTPEQLIDLSQEQGAVISERLSEYVNVGVGDMLHLVDNDGNEVDIPVSKIVENYIEHYVYLSPENYQTIFEEEPTFNALLMQYGANADSHQLEQDFSDKEAVLTYLSLDSIENNVQETMGSLNVITLVLIISAAALAFVVLYNLTNINVSERLRELSTIKVLGFYNREVSMYIYDEVLILTAIGSVIGLVLGVILNQYILKTIQMPNLFFYPIINWPSHLISAAMTFLFSSIVMLVMHQKLKKIDMVEALKAVE